MPVGIFVSASVKNLIAENKFVNFCDLLRSNVHNVNDNVPILIEPGSGGGFHIAFGEASSVKNKVLSWPDWCKAWNVYGALISELQPAPPSPKQLAKHYQVVQALFANGQDWRYYDENFRFAMGAGLELANLRWGEVHEELLMNARSKVSLTSNSSLKSQPFSKSGAGGKKNSTVNGYPKGSCFRYHDGEICKKGIQCQYSHKCFNCGFVHPFVNCRKPIIRPFRFSGAPFRQSPPFGGGKKGPQQFGSKKAMQFKSGSSQASTARGGPL